MDNIIEINSKLNNDNKFKNSITQRIQTESIPICNDCLLDIKKGNYICTICKINLCEEHLVNHLNLRESHKTSLIELYL